MKISGTVLNSKNYNPIALAKIRLEVQDKEIGMPFFTDEHGFYEFKTDEDYIGQTLTYIIEKDGFEEKTYRSVIDKPEIQKKFLLREHKIIADTKTSIKFTVLGICIIAGLFVCLYILQPNMDVDKSVLSFDLDLNNYETQNFTIATSGLGKLNWTITPDEWWIKLEPASGEHSGNLTNFNDKVRVNVTVYAPDTEVSPVKKGTTNLVIKREGGWLNGRFADKVFDKNLKISVSETISSKPILNVEKPVNETWNRTLKPNKCFNLSINNEGDGGLFWTVRKDVKWINLKDVDGMEASANQFRLVGFDEGKVTFEIDTSGLEDGDTGNIFIQSNGGITKITYKINQSKDLIEVHPIFHRLKYEIGE